LSRQLGIPSLYATGEAQVTMGRPKPILKGHT